MKITSVKPQKKNSYRFNVFLDGKFAFGADENTLVNKRLVVGKQIEEKDLEKILFETEVGKLVDRIYNLLSRRSRSEKEIRDYFKIKNYKSRVKGKDETSELVLEALISHLKQKNLINDQEFAKAWVESRRKNKQKGSNAIKGELTQKGIGKEIIEQVLSSELIVYSESDLANQALVKKIKSFNNLDPLTFRRKASQYLMRRGFDYSIVREVVENYLKKE